MAEKEKIKLSGTVETVVFRNDDTGFTVLGEYGDIDFSPLTEESERAFFVCKAE